MIKHAEEFIKECFQDGVDGISFLPSPEDVNEVDIKGFFYNKKPRKYEISDLGNYYHIILYKHNDNDEIVNIDDFVSVLTDPSVYIANLVKCDFYGIISKKTQSKISKNFINTILKNLRKYEVVLLDA